MNRFLLPTILLGTIAPVTLIQTVAISLSPTEINQKAKEFIVKINGSDAAPKGNGSGSIIERDGNIYQVLTNWHVVSESKNLNDYTIQTSDGNEHYLTKIQQLNGADLAIIYFRSDNNYPVATLGDSSKLGEGQTIHYGGYPNKNPRIYRFFRDQSISGLLSSSQAENGYEIIFTGEAFPGMSGSPLLDENGHIIGIYGQSQQEHSGGLSLYGIRVNTAIKLAQQTRSTPSPFQISTSPDFSLRQINRPTQQTRENPPTAQPSTYSPISILQRAIGQTRATLPTRQSTFYLDSSYRNFSGVGSVVISADGKTLVSGSSDHTIKVWNLATGKLLRTLNGHSNFVNSVAISADGNTIVSGSKDDTIKVWNLATGKLLRTLNGHSNFVNSVVISADGKTLVSGSSDHTIKVWNLATGKLLRTLNGHYNFVKSVAISADGKTLVSGSWDKTIKVWNLASGELLRTLNGHSSNSVVISADGKTLVSGSGDNTIKVWNLATGELLRTLNGHSSYVSSVSISADRNTIVSGSGDNTIKVWSLATGKLLRILNGHSDWVNSVAISADGKTIVSGSRDTRIKVWRLKQREFDQEDQDRISSPLATIDKSEI